MTNPSLKQLINSCLLVTYRVNPTPKNLSDSLLIYRGLSEIGNIVQYRLGLCPVTKKRTDKLRVIFHDPEFAAPRTTCKDILVDGRTLVDKASLSELEARVLEVDAIQGNTNIGLQKFTLDLELATRDQDKITRARDLANAKYFHTGTVSNEAVENTRTNILKGFRGLFEKEAEAFKSQRDQK